MEFQCELRNCWQQKEKVLFTLCGEFTVKLGGFLSVYKVFTQKDLLAYLPSLPLRKVLPWK